MVGWFEGRVGTRSGHCWALAVMAGTGRKWNGWFPGSNAKQQTIRYRAVLFLHPARNAKLRR